MAEQPLTAAHVFTTGDAVAAQKVWDYMCAAPSQGAFQGERRAVTPPIGLQPYTTMMSAHSHGPGLQSLRWGGWLSTRVTRLHCTPMHH